MEKYNYTQQQLITEFFKFSKLSWEDFEENSLFQFKWEYVRNISNEWNKENFFPFRSIYGEAFKPSLEYNAFGRHPFLKENSFLVLLESFIVDSGGIGDEHWFFHKVIYEDKIGYISAGCVRPVKKEITDAL